MKDSLQVAAVGTIGGTVILTTINLVLSIIVACLSASFIIWKWRSSIKEKQYKN